jgi:N-acetylglucosaminyldiphosphoundecaprenol N-acetyl-beta-D-mannosaminyltransferase
MRGQVASSVPLDRRLSKPIPIGTITIHDVSSSEAVEWILDRARSRAGGFVCTPNADYVVKAARDGRFQLAVEAADLRVPDGMWIIYASRIAGRNLNSTVTGRMLLPAIAERAREGNIQIAFFGAAPGVASAAAHALKETYPGLVVAASISPPMGLVIGSDADNATIAELIKLRPHVIFVGLGAPKEILWMQAHVDDLVGSVLVGIGAGIDIAAGRFRTAPAWMTRVGLEWVFRLAQEPRRLARRYLLEDPWILWWAVRERLRGRGAIAGR